MSYEKFLADKAIIHESAGIEPREPHAILFPFQRDIVKWALRRGRACLFEDCGTGKTFQSIEWARQIPGDVVIVAPLEAGRRKSESRRVGIISRFIRKRSCCMKTLCYLACPYSHPDRFVREQRFFAVSKAAAKLMGQGMHIFSSISHSHPIAEAGGLPLGWDYWQSFDRAILQECCRMIVLTLDGWKESKGLAAEIVLANEMDIPVEYMEPSP